MTDSAEIVGRARQTPLVELLRDVPIEYVAHWQEKGGMRAHVTSPMGDYCHRAADHIETLTRELAEARGWVAKLYCASGCSCCRDDDGWEEASDRLAQVFDVPRYDDDSGVDWASVRDEFNKTLGGDHEG